MTVAWDSVKTAVAAFVASAGVVPADHVFWEREAHEITYEDVVLLRISAERAVGFDDVEQVLVAPGVYVPRITGWREFTLSIRFNSRSQQTPARAALETVRASLHHPKRLQILTDAGVSFLSTEGLQAFDSVSDDRWESIAVLDVRLGVVSELYAPDTDASTEFLESVGMTINEDAPLTVPE